LRDIHVAGASFKGRITVDPRQLFEAADRLSCDTTLIGKNPRDLTAIIQNRQFLFAPARFPRMSRPRPRSVWRRKAALKSPLARCGATFASSPTREAPGERRVHRRSSCAPSADGPVSAAPRESGAEATALQTLARIPPAPVGPRGFPEAPGPGVSRPPAAD